MRPGIYRRRIRIVAEPGRVRADLEDDLHRVGVVIHHDGHQVTATEGITLRIPWSACPDSARMLERLVGMALVAHPLATHRHTDSLAQCTHMFDLAGLAVAHAARRSPGCRYDMAIPVEAEPAVQIATLHRDGAPLLTWTVDGTRLLAPEPFAGQNLRRLLAWAETSLPDPDLFEPVVVLRRAMLISGSRRYDVDAAPTAAATGYAMGACFTYQPGVAESATRQYGTIRDFTTDPDGLLAD